MDIQDLRTHIFVGNDLNVRLDFHRRRTGSHTPSNACCLLLRQQSLTVRDGPVRGGSQEMTLSMAQAEALGKYLARAPRHRTRPTRGALSHAADHRPDLSPLDDALMWR